MIVRSVSSARMRRKPQLPAEIEKDRDERWRREATRQLETDTGRYSTFFALFRNLRG